MEKKLEESIDQLIAKVNQEGANEFLANVNSHSSMLSILNDTVGSDASYAYSIGVVNSCFPETIGMNFQESLDYLINFKEKVRKLSEENGL